MATPLPNTLYTDPVSTDPYTRAVSDVYRDLAGEASYAGKGIYDPKIFHRVLSKRFPEQLLLSHDLIEGAHVGWARERHRTLRGVPAGLPLLHAPAVPLDLRRLAKIADWCLPRVPAADGKRVPNPLSALNRWKIFDNLRRSLVPPASAAFLVGAWFLSPRRWAPPPSSLPCEAFFPPLSVFHLGDDEAGVAPARLRASCGTVSSGRSRRRPHPAPGRPGRGRAIARVWYRRLVSRRRLLEWTPAQIARGRAGAAPPRSWRVSFIKPVRARHRGRVYRLCPAALPCAAPFLALWLASPLIVWRLCARPRWKPMRLLLSRDDLSMLRGVARQSWRFFDDFVGPESELASPGQLPDLPPERSRPAHEPDERRPVAAESALAARDFGYLTGEEVLRRLEGTFETLETLDRYEGTCSTGTT